MLVRILPKSFNCIYIVPSCDCSLRPRLKANKERSLPESSPEESLRPPASLIDGVGHSPTHHENALEELGRVPNWWRHPPGNGQHLRAVRVAVGGRSGLRCPGHVRVLGGQAKLEKKLIERRGRKAASLPKSSGSPRSSQLSKTHGHQRNYSWMRTCLNHTSAPTDLLGLACVRMYLHVFLPTKLPPPKFLQ